MNILVIGSNLITEEITKLCNKSKIHNKVFSASNDISENIPNIEYKTFQDLANKAKKLQVDVSIICDKSLIQEGLTEFFNKNYLNTISVNKKWLNLETSRTAAKQLMAHYQINTPETIKAPLTFPIILKTDEPNIDFIAKSMQELIDKKSKISQKTFLEEYLEGTETNILCFWDGKNLWTNSSDKSFSEVQTDRFELLKTKLNFMLSDEKADFIGIFNIKLIWAKNDWYVLEFIMHLNETFEINIKTDFLYLINSAIYQKLNEI